MKWVKRIDRGLHIKSWCEDIEKEAMEQATNLAKHPVTVDHVALMPDCHFGYGMPIGGVIACKDAIIPNAVGVDIGCGMIAVETDRLAESLIDMKNRRFIIDEVKKIIPVGQGKFHAEYQQWAGWWERFKDNTRLCPGVSLLPIDKKNLGTLGGGNHFIEFQEADNGKLWLMIHSGSRNLGFRIANFYHKKALELNKKWYSRNNVEDLAFLPSDSDIGKQYIEEMQFALSYALENRRLMMCDFKFVVSTFFAGNINFSKSINIHHNYAALENHFGNNVWVHRKGATSAKKGELGIIPGSMGTSSYIVEGLGCEDSFMSCSHGAGRTMGRREASKQLSVEDCDKSMSGIAFDRWKNFKKRKNQEDMLDLSESPLAYKNIDEVIDSQLDLIKPIVKLTPLGVIKG